ncbi:MAG: SDR family NAD(P)-dependent oxidoreductase [Lachnospiraceae bacterium]|nr:SDR family NAD(P)-dependent oxidoreductase [Lachnospiraceae bacterium]
MDLNGKVALITGSGKGIGKGIAKCMLEYGAKVCIHYNSNEELAIQTFNELTADGGEAILRKADVSDPAQCKALVESVVEHFGKLDILVDNAAMQYNRNLDEYDERRFNYLIDVNLCGYLNMIQYALPYLKETQGVITTISSVHGKRPTDFDPAYSFSKGGIKMLVRETALECMQYGVRINSLLPGGVKIEFKTGEKPGEAMPQIVRTPPKFADGFQLPDMRTLFASMPPSKVRRQGLPKDLGYACVFLSSPLAEHITGAAIRVEAAAMLR